MSEAVLAASEKRVDRLGFGVETRWVPSTRKKGGNKSQRPTRSYRKLWTMEHGPVGKLNTIYMCLVSFCAWRL